MKTTKNILLTSIVNSNHNAKLEYYAFTADNLNSVYCSAISASEAGTKFALSNYPIDSIVVLGPQEACNKKDFGKKFALCDSVMNGNSAFEVYCNRISQHICCIDCDWPDIDALITDEERQHIQELGKIFEQLDGRTKELIRRKDLFHYFSIHPDEFMAMTAQSQQTINAERWVKHKMFLRLSESYKMRSMDRNKNVTATFLPLSTGNTAAPIDNITSIFSFLYEDKVDEINLYIDFQNLEKADSFILESILSILNRNSSVNFHTRCIIATRHHPNEFTAEIKNEISRYNLENLFSGLNSFLQYGKVDILKFFWQDKAEKNKDIADMISGMEYVDTGISLCNIENLKYGIRIIKDVISRNDVCYEDEESLVFKILSDRIIEDYGDMLKGEEPSVIELLKWANRKHLYQQMLTIIESCIPDDLIKRGIYYYADSEEQKEVFKAEYKKMFLEEDPRFRYAFYKPNHHFIKTYGRNLLDHKKEKMQKTYDYADMRVKETESDTTMIKAFTIVENKELLKELLFFYYHVGDVRNEINHAGSDSEFFRSTEFITKNHCIEKISEVIDRFIFVYQKVLNSIEGKPYEPHIVNLDEMKTFLNARPPMAKKAPVQTADSDAKADEQGNKPSASTKDNTEEEKIELPQFLLDFLAQPLPEPVSDSAEPATTASEPTAANEPAAEPAVAPSAEPEPVAKKTRVSKTRATKSKTANK